MELAMRQRLLRALGCLSFACLTGSALAETPADKGAAAAPMPLVDKGVLVVPSGTDGHHDCWWGAEADHGAGWGSGIVAGAGLYYLAPYNDSNRAFSVTTLPPANVVGPTHNDFTDFNTRYDASPRVWLGYVGDSGWGLRVSFWYFEQTVHSDAVLTGENAALGDTLSSAAPLGITPIFAPTAVSAPGNADLLRTSNRYELEVWDFEATKATTAWDIPLLLSGGVRVARLEQSYSAAIANTANDPTVISEVLGLTALQRFLGAGPTGALQTHIPFGDSGFGAYGTVRASLLVGEDHQRAETATQLSVGGVPNNLPGTLNTATRYAVVPEGDIEVGLEWRGRFGGTRPFMRAGVFAATFFDALNNNASFGSGSGLNGDLTLFGFSLSAGLTY
jgi:hypothetical protein